MAGAKRSPTYGRAAAWGALTVVVYLVAASSTLGTGKLPLRPFFEGTAPPQPYRWVNPPKEFKAGNQPAELGNGAVALDANGSMQANVLTNDGQAALVLYKGSVRARDGETRVNITIEPLDPARVGPPPKGLQYSGNAYRVTALYEKSREPAVFASETCPANQQPKLCPTIVLRFPVQATAMFLRDGSTWSKLTTTSAAASLQIFGDTPKVGIFVAAARPLPGESRLGTYVGIAVGGTAVVVALLVGRSSRVRRRWTRWQRNRQVAARRKVSASSRRPSPPRKRKPPPKTYGKRKRKR